MESSILFDAFQSISLDFDESSIEFIGKLMEKKKISIVNLQGIYYFKENYFIVELNEIKNIITNGISNSKKPQIANTVIILHKIQNGNLDNICNHFDNSSCSGCKSKNDDGIFIRNKTSIDLTIRYLFEKVKILEHKLTLLNKKHV